MAPEDESFELSDDENDGLDHFNEVKELERSHGYGIAEQETERGDLGLDTQEDLLNEDPEAQNLYMDESDVDEEQAIGEEYEEDAPFLGGTGRMLSSTVAPTIREARSSRFAMTASSRQGHVNEAGLTQVQGLRRLTQELGYKLPAAGGGIMNSFFNMANSIIGAGIIGLPFAFAHVGWAIGIVLLLALTVVVDWTIRLIVVNAKLTGKNTYQDIVEHCFGNAGLWAVSLAQVLFAFGGMVGFCVIIGDTIPDVFASTFPKLQHNAFWWILTNRRFMILACTLLISYPLSLYRDITKLAKASALALVSMCLIIFTVISQGPFVSEMHRGQEAPKAAVVNWHSIKAISVISFAFVCHHNSLLIYGSLNTPTINRFAKVTHISTGVSCIACMIMALTGYLVFVERTRGNILNNFSRDDGNVMVIIARFCFGFNCFTTLPIEAFVCREVVIHTAYAPRTSRPYTTRDHVLVTSGFVFAAMFISLFVHDLGVVLDITGGTSACALAYILPPMCYIKSLEGPLFTDFRKWAAGICVIFGLMVMIGSVVSVTLRLN